MNKKSLEEKRISIQQQHEAMVKQRNEIQVGLHELEGQFKLVTEQLDNLPEDPKKDNKSGK